jgi:RNA polymerase sigma factor (sigma-70 family)
MAYLASGSVIRQLGSLFEGGSVAGLSDRQLLDRFAARRDDAAFAALVTRHGPMVLGVCRQLLGDRHHAEDAFQAVFLVLARKARSIRDPDLLGNWLYGVALRTARCARLRLDRRRECEEVRSMSYPDPASTGPADQPAIDREQAEALHDEIDRLPNTFRLPIVLCYFEGLTVEEAARRLQWPHGTVRSRLARAREKLRRGLTRRGVVLPAAALAAVLDARSASASVSSPLCNITTRAALTFAAGQTTSTLTVALAREVLRSMLIHKLKFIALTLLFLGGIATGAGFLSHALAMQDEPRKVPAAPQSKAAEKPQDPPAPGRMFVVGRVVDPFGKPVPDATTMVYAQTKVPRFRGGFEKRFPSAIGRAKSDASGRFRLDAARISSATHSRIGATAIAPGYGAGWADLDPDVDQPDVEIALRPEQVIQGRLFDLHGRPAEGVTITVDAMGRVVRRNSISAPDGLEGPGFWWAGAKDLPAWPRPATSDREGRFTLHGVGRDLRAVLVVDDPRFAAQRIEVDMDGASASKALEPARSLTGRVTYADTGKPAAHALFQIFTDGKGLVHELATDDDGRFGVTPVTGDHLSVGVFAPRGRPYLSTSKILDWPKGAIQHSLEFSLVRGIAVHGRVTEEGSGKPVPGAIVDFISVNSRTEGATNLSETGPDGSFQTAARPGAGYLIVRGPSDDYLLRESGQNMIFGGRPGGPRTYAHAFIACDVKPESESQEVNAVLRRGVTLAGRAIGPDDRPVRDAQMIARLFPYPPFRSWTQWLGTDHGRVLDGRFALHGLDPDTEVPIHFFDPRHQLGATVRVSGKSASGGPLTVRLEPCGTARARLVAPGGKPIPGHPLMIRMVITPGADPFSEEDKAGHLFADQAGLSLTDPLNYGTGPVSDGQGTITLPALIPGATYRIYDSTTLSETGGRPLRKEFTVKPGETLDLGDIRIEKPPS